MKALLLLLVPILLNTPIANSQPSPNAPNKYICLPCGQECDNQEYDEPGKCAHCQMDLVKKSTITFTTITPANICSYISKHPTALLLDVRTREEFQGNHEPNYGTLKNAINIPIGEIRSRLVELDLYKGREIIVFCSHSHRSPQVSYLLTQNGFKNIRNMSGGMSVLTDSRCKK
jgi:rhodanese-related sulfurtransferase